MRWLWRIAAGLVLVASVAAFLGSYGEPFELLSNFRVQFLILAALLIAPGTVTPDRATIAMVLLALAGNMLGIAPRTLINTAPEAPTGATPTRIVWATLYRKQEALDRLAAWLRAHPADVVAVTELPPGGEGALHKALPDFVCITGHQQDGNPFAVAIATHASTCVKTPTPADVQTLPSPSLSVIALHSRPPWDNRRLAMRDRTIHEAISLANGNHFLIVGDFNATPWSPVFRTMEAGHLRRANCGAPWWRPSWRSQNPLLGLTLDQAWLGPDLGVVSCDLGPDIGSDHRPLVVTVGPR